MSSRLKKVAMDANAFQGTIDQTSKKGREILKSLEDLKFTFEQTARLLKNNQEMSQGMIQKRKEIDGITQKLYQIVFDIENMDISLAFTNQNQPVVEEVPTKSPMGEDSVEKQEENNSPIDQNNQAVQPPSQPPTPPEQSEPSNSQEQSDDDDDDEE